MRARFAVETFVSVVAFMLLGWAVLVDDTWIATHATRRYCFTDDATIHRAHLARILAFAIGLVLAMVVRRRLARRVEGKSLSTVLVPAMRIVAAVVLAFVVTDLALRLRTKEPRGPSLGFAHEPKQTLTVHSKWGPDVLYAVDGNGYRARSADDAIDFTAPTIIWSGESIVFGAWLDVDQTIPVLVGNDLGIQSANLGVGGMANDLSLMRLERELPRFSQPKAVVAFVLVNWLERNAGEDRDHYVPFGDGVRLAPPTTPAFIRSSPLFAALRIATRFHSDDALESTRAVIRATDTLVKKHGALPLFVFMQAGERCIKPDLRARVTKGLEIQAIDVDLPERLFFPGDTHPTPEGAVAIAEKITPRLREALRGR